MSQLFVDNIKSRTGGAIGAPSGAVVTGVVTATSFVGSGVGLSGIDATALKDSGGSIKVQANTSGIVVTGVSTFSGNVSVGGTLTYEDVTNIDSVGLITARSGIDVTGTIKGYDSLQAGYADIVSGPTPDPIVYNVTYADKDSTHRYFGQGSGKGYKIDGVFSPWLTLTPGRKYRFLMSSSDMTAHPFRFYKEADKTTEYTDNVTSTATYTEILVTDSTPQVLHYQCSQHGYMGNGVSTLSNVSGAGGGGITTAQQTPSANALITLDLGTAQYHDIRLTAGITTITCTGGTAGDSHSVVLTQPSSGITTVGFSSYFKFPSGSFPSLSEGSGKIDLVSFVIRTEGATGVSTELLASSGLNYLSQV